MESYYLLENFYPINYLFKAPATNLDIASIWITLTLIKYLMILVCYFTRKMQIPINSINIITYFGEMNYIQNLNCFKYLFVKIRSSKSK